MDFEIPTGIRPSTHHIRIAGCTYEFQMVPTSDNSWMCHAPGIMPFGVATLDEARDTLRSVYHKDD